MSAQGLETVPPEIAAGQPGRAAGAIMGAACGDALGAPYEFHPPANVTLNGT